MTCRLSHYLCVIAALLAGDASRHPLTIPRSIDESLNVHGACCIARGQSSLTPQRVPLAIYTNFKKAPPRSVAKAMRSEVESILAPLHLPIAWWESSGPRPRYAAAALAVVTLLGECDADATLPPNAETGPLGWTYVTDGVIQSFAEVDCDRVHRVIGQELTHSAPWGYEEVFGQAVGRVVAHELYHIFVATEDHSDRGLAKPSVTAVDLTRGQFRFQAREVRALRAALSQSRLACRSVRGLAGGSPVVGRSIYQENGCAGCHGSRGQGTHRGPALRGQRKPQEFRSLAERLATNWVHMSRNLHDGTIEPPALDEDEIADLVSFLSELN